LARWGGSWGGTKPRRVGTALLAKREMRYSRVRRGGCRRYPTYLKAIFPFPSILTGSGGKKKEIGVKQ